MAASAPSPAPPSNILAFAQAHQRTAALRAALELDLFSAIAEGADTPPTMAARCVASERGIRTLANYLCMLGLLTAVAEHYSLSAEAADYLDRNSPEFIGDAVMSAYSGAALRAAYDNLTRAIRRGGTALEAAGTMTPEHPSWPDHARALSPVGRLMGPALADLLEAGPRPRLKLLDIAAGHGLYGIAIAQANPRAEIHAVDWPQVLAVARLHAEQAGVASRYHLIPGDVFTVEIGDGYDLALLANFLPDFDARACEALLERVGRALAPGGQVAAMQWELDANRTAPAQAIALDLMLLATTPGGQVYTRDEMESIFRHAGFNHVETHDLPPFPQCVVVAST